ncbi:MAG: O-antigen ligase family protein, partial [Sulfuricellaceae bacterium]|nr:O-antigen ligase family protein [Sulfuricellaceae bacterium]
EYTFHNLSKPLRTDDKLAQAMRFLLLALVFLQPLNHVNALRLLSLYLLLGLFCFRLIQQGRVYWAEFTDPATLGLLALAVWAVLASVLGPYPLESLNAARKSLMPQILLYLVVLGEFRSPRQIQQLFTVIVTSFMAVTLLSAEEILRIGVNAFNPGMISHDMFLDGYASNAGFYLPFTLLYLFSREKREYWGFPLRISATLTLACGYIIVLLYNSRTALIAIALSSLLTPLLLKRYRLLLAVGAALLLAGGLSYYSGAELSKYQSLLHPATYVSNAGLSERLSVWAGAWDVVRERFIAGYGYGWKKLAWVINDKGWIGIWEKSQRADIIAYYAPQGKAHYGRVNPHNLLLQLLFEMGLIGVLLYAQFWVQSLKRILSGAFRRGQPYRPFLAGSLGVILSYLLLNLTNGYWEGTLANMLIVLLACTQVLALAPQRNERPVSR